MKNHVTPSFLLLFPFCASYLHCFCKQVLHSRNGDKKFNKDITLGLIRKKLLNLTEYNFHMAKLIDARKNGIGTSIF